jgi:hypothetical protein
MTEAVPKSERLPEAYASMIGGYADQNGKAVTSITCGCDEKKSKSKSSNAEDAKVSQRAQRKCRKEIVN